MAFIVNSTRNDYIDLEMSNNELKNEINDKIKEYVNNEIKDNKEIVIRVIHGKQQLTEKEINEHRAKVLEQIDDFSKGLCYFGCILFSIIGIVYAIIFIIQKYA